MATTKDTFRSDVTRLLDLCRLKKPLYRLYWDYLEHDSYTAKQKAKETREFDPRIESELVERLEYFRAAYESLEKVLLRATRNSDKF